jgi:hypothetical protein
LPETVTDGSIVGGIEPDDDVGPTRRPDAAENASQQLAADLGAAAAAAHFFRLRCAVFRCAGRSSRVIPPEVLVQLRIQRRSMWFFSRQIKAPSAFQAAARGDGVFVPGRYQREMMPLGPIRARAHTPTGTAEVACQRRAFADREDTRLGKMMVSQAAISPRQITNGWEIDCRRSLTATNPFPSVARPV